MIRVEVRRQVDAAANGLFGLGPDCEAIAKEAALDVGVVGDGCWTGKYVFVHVQADGRLVVCRRDEDAALRIHMESEHRRRVEVREEDQRIVRRVLLLQVLDQRRTPGPLLLQPCLLVRCRVGVAEDPIRVRVERLQVAGLRGRKSANSHSTDPVGALG